MLPGGIGSALLRRDPFLASLLPCQSLSTASRCKSCGPLSGCCMDLSGGVRTRLGVGGTPLAMLSNFGPGVLANFGPPPVLEPTVIPIGLGGLLWTGKPKWNCSSNSVGSMNLGSGRSRAWRQSSASIGGLSGGRSQGRCHRRSITRNEASRSWGRWPGATHEIGAAN
jgi:hypothetical protein